MGKNLLLTTPWTALTLPKNILMPQIFLAFHQAVPAMVQIILASSKHYDRCFHRTRLFSIAAPASYWYLMGFRIADFSDVVDYIVYMTYDQLYLMVMLPEAWLTSRI
jgi:hypothetical protein